MTEPLRSDAAAPASDVSDRARNALLEDLLLSGLDHYFRGQYELAINVWTRVLFLDRGHARARAYIERARSAVSERQRESEELIQTGAAAFHRGEKDAARRLLTSAVERGAETEETFALLGRLDRLEAAGVQQETRPERRSDQVRSLAPVESLRATHRATLAWIAAGVILGIGAGALALALIWARGDLGLTFGTPAPRQPVSRAVDEPLPTASSADTQISLACGLQAKGRLHEALRALDGVRPGDPAKPRADQFRAFMQMQLLSASRGGQSGPTPGKPQGSGVYCQ